MESSRSLLLSVLTDSCLKETGSLPFDLVARAKLLAADLIQQEGFVVKSTSELLSSMSSGADERGLFKLTPIELVIDASRLMIKLADHKKVLEEADTVDQPGWYCTIRICIHTDNDKYRSCSKQQRFRNYCTHPFLVFNSTSFCLHTYMVSIP